MLSSSLLVSSLELSDTQVYEPQIRACLGTAARFCEVVSCLQINTTAERLAGEVEKVSGGKVGGPRNPHSWGLELKGSAWSGCLPRCMSPSSFEVRDDDLKVGVEGCGSRASGCRFRHRNTTAPPRPSEEGTAANVTRTSTCTPRPESGLDCDKKQPSQGQKLALTGIRRSQG